MGPLLLRHIHLFNSRCPCFSLNQYILMMQCAWNDINAILLYFNIMYSYKWHDRHHHLQFYGRIIFSNMIFQLYFCWWVGFSGRSRALTGKGSGVQDVKEVSIIDLFEDIFGSGWVSGGPSPQKHNNLKLPLGLQPVLLRFKWSQINCSTHERLSLCHLPTPIT